MQEFDYIYEKNVYFLVKTAESDLFTGRFLQISVEQSGYIQPPDVLSEGISRYRLEGLTRAENR